MSGVCRVKIIISRLFSLYMGNEGFFKNLYLRVKELYLLLQ